MTDQLNIYNSFSSAGEFLSIVTDFFFLAVKQEKIFTHLELNHLFCFILVRRPVKTAQQVSFLPPNYFAMPSLQMDIKWPAFV